MQQFLRVHRSLIINLAHVDEVAEPHVMIAQKPIALGTGMREQFMPHMRAF